MRRAASHLLTMILLLAPTVAHTTTTIVPDQHGTIQAAIDSGVDTVFVRAGTYDENLVVSGSPGSRWLLSIPSSNGSHVRVLGTTLFAQRLTAQNVHFRGLVRVPGDVPSIDFTTCRLDSGFQNSPLNSGVNRMTGCIVRNGIVMSSIVSSLRNCSFIGGHVDLRSEGSGSIEYNYFAGPGDFGLRFKDTDPNFSRVAQNIVEGFVDGIIITSPGRLTVEGNEVRRCSGSGYRTLGYARNVLWSGNRASSCGGYGFDLEGSHRIEGCSAESVGVAGFRLRQGFDTPSSRVAGNRVRHAGSHGIWYEEIVVPTDPVAFLGNAVDHVAGDGIRVVFAADPGPPPADSLMFNVTGHCGGHGILLSNPGTTMRVGGNTSYLNGGSGFLVQGTPVQSFDHNIGAFNNAYGLVATAAFVPACNDWFANQSGAGSGISPGPTDLALDPRFCDAVNDDVRLASSSPLANAAGCGQVGALGIGCATSAAAMTGDHRELFTASPVPASTHLQFRWRRAEAPGVLEVFDVTGARRWSTRIRTGEDGVRWETVDDTGRPLAPGMYWARLKWRSRIESTRIAIVR